MTRISLTQLERHLFAAADVLRGRMDVSAYQGHLLGMLFLKRSSDEFQPQWHSVHNEALARTGDRAEALARADDPDSYRDLYVPPRARWWAGPHHDPYRPDSPAPGLSQLTGNVGEALDQALAALADANNTLTGIGDRIAFGEIPDTELRSLVRHFSLYRLRNEDFAFPEMLGAAYEYLLGRFADSAGQRGGEFHTPREVVRMMVQLVDPRPGDTVYDPCAGTGGMLVEAREYVREHGGDPHQLMLCGQDANGSSWFMGTMNMLLHNVREFELKNGDTLTDPQHLDRHGRLRKFTKVLSNPPFSLHYEPELVSKADTEHGERMHWGWATGSRADLMYVQHMVSVLAEGGIAATILPHGPLFRGGADRLIREGLLRDDVVEAVIGLGPNLFHHTGISACVVVLRRPGSKTPERAGKVLFINASRDYVAGRAKNKLDPEHSERIVETFLRWREQPDYARVVGVDELLGADANLGVGRWVNPSPPAEPQNVRAHLYGGVPASEISAVAHRFHRYGIEDIGTILAERKDDPDYYGFLPDGAEATAARIPERTAAREQGLREAYGHWWRQFAPTLIELVFQHDLMTLRGALTDGVIATVGGVGMLDEDVLSGIVADWWTAHRYDLKVLATGGCERVLQDWVDSIEAAVEPSAAAGSVDGKTVRATAAERRRAMDRPVVRRLIPAFLTDVTAADRALMAAKAAYETAQDATEEATGAGTDVGLRKRERLSAARLLRELDLHFLPSLRAAAEQAVAQGTVDEVVLAVLGQDLADRLDAAVAAGRTELIATFRTWAQKYAVSLADAKRESMEADRALSALLVGRITSGEVFDSSWPTVPLGSVLRSRPSRGYGGRSVPERTGVFALGMGSITAEGFVPRPLKHVPDDAVTRQFRLVDGDLLVGLVGEQVGRAMRYRDVGDPCVYPHEMMCLRTDARECLPEYAEVVLRSERVRQWMRTRVQTSAGMMRLSPAAVTECPIPLPPLNEQAQVVAAQNAFERRAKALRDELEKLRVVRRGVLGNLLGEPFPEGG
ncbi:N-6 DNA methylase [Streptomyces brevispora]|uniref:site-specific DNA-methyltransferase (adenine-specific) n=1 Tax=Streptomyces brevispora TaxID=887462 RepID=A0ABZ1G4Y7_9ACTN|nr:N-6 DNA methylase [Streptomyces brevispora]WSC14959.1 N-6 DNA methylase [Streptomyces brevispora]